MQLLSIVKDIITRTACCYDTAIATIQMSTVMPCFHAFSNVIKSEAYHHWCLSFQQREGFKDHTCLDVCNSQKTKLQNLYFIFRSIKYENQSGDDGNGFWTPHSKEIFGWQTNNARGDTLIVNYVTMNSNDAKWSMNSIKLKHTSEDVVAHWSHLLGTSRLNLSGLIKLVHNWKFLTVLDLGLEAQMSSIAWASQRL